MKRKHLKSICLAVLIIAVAAALFTGCGQKQTPAHRIPVRKHHRINPAATNPVKLSTTIASVNNGPMVTMSELSGELRNRPASRSTT